MREDLAEAKILEVIAGMVFHHDDLVLDCCECARIPGYMRLACSVVMSPSHWLKAGGMRGSAGMCAPFVQLEAHFGFPARNHERVRRVPQRNPAMGRDVAWCDEEEWSYQSNSSPRRLGPIKS